MSRSTPVIGYASAYGEKREHLDGELRRQADKITAECERRGLLLLDVVREGEPSHQRPPERVGLGYALGLIAAGEARGLVVSEPSQISHSVRELGRVLEWLAERGVRFVAAAPNLDTDEEAGRLALKAIIEVSRWERRRLVDRTRKGMRAARRKGPPRVADRPELRERISRMREDGMTLQAIADRLNAEGIATVRGGAKWRPSSVQVAAGYRRPRASRALEPRP